MASLKSARTDIERVTRIVPDDAAAAMALMDCNGKIYEFENPGPTEAKVVAEQEKAQGEEGGRYRIPIEVEDEDEDEDEEEPVVEDVVRPREQGTRVTIEEDEDEDEDEDVAAAMPAAGGGQGTRIMIEDEDEDEEDEPKIAVPTRISNPEASEAAKVLGNEALTAKVRA